MKSSTRFILSLFLGLLFGGLHWAGVGEYLEEVTIDARLRSRPIQTASQDVRLVAIGDRDVGSESLGRWPFPRAVHGDVLQILEALGVRHVTVDILFTETSQAEQDERLKLVLDGRDDLTLAYYFEALGRSNQADSEAAPHFIEGRRYGLAVEDSSILRASGPVPPFAELRAGYGAVNVQPSKVDELVRKVPLFIAHDDRLYPTLAMQTIIQALEADPDQIRIEPGRAVELIGTKRGNLRIPIDRQGQYRVNFLGSLDSFGESYQYLDLYAAVSDEAMAQRIGDALKDRVVLIGNVSTGNSDVVNTPLGRIPGMAVQATVVSNILEGNHLERLPLWAEAILIVLITLLFAALMRPSRPWLNVTLFVLLIAGWVLGAFVAIRYDWVLPLTPVLEANLVALLILLPFQITTLVGSLAPFIPLPLRRLVLENRPLPSSTVRREVSVFFADLRGFTEWTDSQEPDEVALALNEYLTAMTEVVEKHGGTLDKFIGDCIMVFFGAPDQRKDHALASVRMAMEMQHRTKELAETWKSAGREPLKAGMGIHTEWVTVGNFGSVRFQDYTVIGRGVNLAARIESWAPGGTILISAKTNALVQNSVKTRLFAELKLKGISQPAEVYEVLEDDASQAADLEPSNQFVIEAGERLGPFPETGIDLMIRCGRIEPDAVIEGENLTASHRAKPDIG